MLNRLRKIVAELPHLMRAGLTIAALGGVIDIGYHVASDAPGAGHGPVAFVGHVITLAGMVITLIGLFAAASKRPPIETRTSKGESWN